MDLSRQLANSKITVKFFSSILAHLNSHMMMTYQHAFPKREFSYYRYDYTGMRFTTYQTLFLYLCQLFNVNAYRHPSNSSVVYIVGRDSSMKSCNDFFTRIVSEIEEKVEDEKLREVEVKVRGKGVHMSAYLSIWRKTFIANYCESLETIYHLKKEQYLDKYARIRQVRENEILDKTFFKEFMRESRLSHLKQYKWLIN